jgi:uncharacterized SAM-binding protein YcdF (DUF218 family)
VNAQTGIPLKKQSSTAKSDQPTPRRLRWALRAAQGFFAGVGLLLLIVTQSPLDIWWTNILSGPHNHPKGEVLVVLGGGLLRDDILDESSYARSVAAVRAWRGGGFKTIVLSGGAPRGNHSAAESMKEFLVGEGIPPEAIRMETLSRSTRENALFTKPILEAIPGRKVLITSDAHMFRARRAFQRLGVEVLPWPCPDVETTWQNEFGGWDAFAVLTAETGKIGYYYVRGWI